MSQISLKSISGITSITTPAGVDNQFTLHNYDTSEAVKLDIAGNLHFHNHLNITGVTTFADDVTIKSSNPLKLSNAGNSASCQVLCDGGARLHLKSYNQTMATFENGQATIFYTDSGQNRLQISNNGNVSIAKDLDVDGHTNLDNVSVAGVTTHQGLFKLPDSTNNQTGRLMLGTGTDLQIFHTGSAGEIGNFTGNLNIKTNSFRLFNGGATQLYIKADQNDSVILHHSNNEKIRTTNTGAVVTGILTATSFAPTAVTAQLSHRNILHNGEFKVIQRYGTSFTINSSSDSEFTFDRWYTANHDNLGDFTVSQEADAPAGFRTSVKVQCTSTDTSSSGNEQSFIQQTVEAQNVSHIFNGSSSQPMTLSFYYKSNATTTRQLWFYTPDSTRHYSAVFTPSATNTWERFTISIPADTANTVNDDNGPGFYVRFMIGAGTVYKSGRPTSWTGLSNDRYSGVTNLTTNTANNFYITGVQLEMGSQATPYEHRTMSEELVNCQRYYYPYKSILKGSSSGADRPWIPVQLFLNSASSNDAFVVIAGLNEQRAKMRTGRAEVRVLSPLNSAPVTTYPSAGEWAYFYRGQGSGFYSGGGAFTWNDGYYNMYGCRSIANPRPTQIMIETNSEVGKVYVELDDEI